MNLSLRALAESTAGLEKKLSFLTQARGPVANEGFAPYKTAIVHVSKDAPTPGIGGVTMRMPAALGLFALSAEGRCLIIRGTELSSLPSLSIHLETALPHQGVQPPGGGGLATC